MGCAGVGCYLYLPLDRYLGRYLPRVVEPRDGGGGFCISDPPGAITTGSYLLYLFSGYHYHQLSSRL